MNKVETELGKAFSRAIAKAFGQDSPGTDPLLKASANPAFGDYQANLAMSLAKTLGRKPRDVADAIVAKLDLDGIAGPAEVAGPGFINIRLLPAFLSEAVRELGQDPLLGAEPPAKPDLIVLDYSSPNVAKEMHVGHLRSTIIGDSLARTALFLGHGLIRQNHLGDWGTQFGMLIERILELGGTAALGSISDLNALYQEAKARFDADQVFAERARGRVVALQAGDRETVALWKGLIASSKKHFEVVYKTLGVLLTEEDYCPESFYNERLAATVEALLASGKAHVSDGAVCLFPEGFTGPEGAPVPLILRKGDGGYGYDTTDMAAIRYRSFELGGTRLVYLTDSRQRLHFAMIFQAAKEAGWLAQGARAEHAPFGAILGEDGKPFKTRSGEAPKLQELLDEAVKRAYAVVAEKNPAMPEAERLEVARVVGIGAVKYADLSNDRVKDYVFSWERMLAFEGNTAPYLQNAYVRIESIFRKAGANPEASILDAPAATEPAERALALQFLRFGASVEGALRVLEPHRVCGYLYDLASAYHAFYEACPVLAAPDEAVKRARLASCALAAKILKTGLGLLGIDVVERM